jgi:hypothetical protein
LVHVATRRVLRPGLISRRTSCRNSLTPGIVHFAPNTADNPHRVRRDVERCVLARRSPCDSSSSQPNVTPVRPATAESPASGDAWWRRGAHVGAPVPGTGHCPSWAGAIIRIQRGGPVGRGPGPPSRCRRRYQRRGRGCSSCTQSRSTLTRAHQWRRPTDDGDRGPRQGIAEHHIRQPRPNHHIQRRTNDGWCVATGAVPRLGPRTPESWPTMRWQPQQSS